MQIISTSSLYLSSDGQGYLYCMFRFRYFEKDLQGKDDRNLINKLHGFAERKHKVAFSLFPLSFFFFTHSFNPDTDANPPIITPHTHTVPPQPPHTHTHTNTHTHSKEGYFLFSAVLMGSQSDLHRHESASVSHHRRGIKELACLHRDVSCSTWWR